MCSVLVSAHLYVSAGPHSWGWYHAGEKGCSLVCTATEYHRDADCSLSQSFVLRYPPPRSRSMQGRCFLYNQIFCLVWICDNSSIILCRIYGNHCLLTYFLENEQAKEKLSKILFCFPKCRC